MVIALFPHVKTTGTNTGTNNMWACVSIWAFGVLFRLIYTALSVMRIGKLHGKGRVNTVGSATVLDLELSGMSRRSNRAVAGEKARPFGRALVPWKAGQFCYLRFPKLAPFVSPPGYTFSVVTECSSLAAVAPIHPRRTSDRYLISFRRRYSKWYHPKARCHVHGQSRSIIRRLS